MSKVIDGPWSKLQSNKRIENATECGMTFGQNTIIESIAMFKTAMSLLGKTDDDAKRAIAEIHEMVKKSSAYKESSLVAVAALLTVALGISGSEIAKVGGIKE